MPDIKFVAGDKFDVWHQEGTMFECHRLTDEELTVRLLSLAREERSAGASLVAHLMEFENRGLHEDAGHVNLFTYCRQVLRFSESSTYKKIRAVEAARRHPEVVEWLADGRIHLETLVLLGPCLGDQTYLSLLQEAGGKTKREVEAMVARFVGRSEKVDSIKHFKPVSAASVPATEPPSLFEPAPSMLQPAAAVEAPSEPRVRFSFTGSEELFMKMEKAKSLLRHKHPEGRLEDVLGEVVEIFLERKDPERRIKRKAALKRPPRSACSDGRRIPQAVKDEAWQRDGGRCAFLRRDGSRCEQTGGLEFDHIVPFALGGTSTNAKNIRLLCRGHNQLRARREFGGPARRPLREGGTS